MSGVIGRLRRVPLFGSLVDARARDHTEALFELGPGLVLATAPIWAGAFFIFIFKRPQTSILRLLYDNIHSGEFCLYATALLAPLYYFIFKDYKEAPNRKFPNGRSFMLIGAVILVLSTLLFAGQKASEATAHQHHDHAERLYVVTASFVLYAIAIVVVYVAHVYRNFFESGAANVTATTTQNFVHEFIENPRDKPS